MKVFRARLPMGRNRMTGIALWCFNLAYIPWVWNALDIATETAMLSINIT